MKVKNGKSKLDFSYMNVDNFLENLDVVSDNEGSDEVEELPELEINTVEKKTKKDKKKSEVAKKSKKEKAEQLPKRKKKVKQLVETSNDKPDAFDGTDSEPEQDEQKHKEALKRLKNVDPEFYQFLEQNDKKLLKFGADFDGTDPEGGSEDEKESDLEEALHKPGQLEVASDESDFEAEGQEHDPKSDLFSVTLKMLKNWEVSLKSDKIDIQVLKDVTQAFNSALISISGDHTKQGKFTVEGSAVFNGILQLCILNLEPALKKFLGILAPGNIKSIHKAKKFKKIQSLLRLYLLDIVNLLENVTSNNILTVLLKHLHQLASTFPAFPSITKPVLKRLVKLWSGSEETIRILAFLCILRITREQQPAYLSNVLKMMYLSYVQNSKFVSPSTLPNINFMRRSLAEIFALDLNVAYQHAFLYIRQLAIHLRNAVVLKKKESHQAVYNWQYINSLRLWVDILSITSTKQQLQPLIYPLVSIISSVIRLSPTAAFFPLRFHCCSMLINLSRNTKTFIPVLPFVLETLNSTTFLAKHKKLSMRPLKFTCILHLSQSQCLENAYKDEVIEQVYGLTLEYLAHESSSIAFPDLVIMPLMMLRQYMKTGGNTKYNKKIKELVDKIQENATFMERERNQVNFTLKDYQMIAGWEHNVKNKGTPLWNFYEQWVTTTTKKKRKEAANTDVINAFDMPTINKGAHKRKINDKGGPVDLFPSSDSETELEVEKIVKKQKKNKKVKKQQLLNPDESTETDIEDSNNAVDIVEDFNIDDW